MKKLFLLGALVCAGHLYGMEEKADWSSLPKDVQEIIIRTAFETSKNVDETIKTIEAMSTLQGVEYSLKDFTKLVHVLADKFNMATAEVAGKFTTQIAKKYQELVMKLVRVLTSNNVTSDDIISLVNQGADVNATFLFGSIITMAVAIYFNIEGIEVLLNLGAKPTNKDLDEVRKFTPFSADGAARKDKIIQLLEKAIEEQQ